MSTTYGYTGKILRIDLSTGKIWTDDTMPSTRISSAAKASAMKVLWDEVPAGTHPFAPENKIVFGAGPLCGSGVPCSAGRPSSASCPPAPSTERAARTWAVTSRWR
jgi:aldehyde:ferredoxin oxidoreductase